MLFEKKRVLGKDNRGLSLVELLVAMAIGTVVSASIASLLVFSLRMYGKETVDVQMQQEIQTTSNIIIDAIMDSESFIVAKSSDSASNELIDTAVLGSFEYNPTSSVLEFSGYVFCSDNVDSATKDGKLYMKRYSVSNPKNLADDCVVDGLIVPSKVIEKLSAGVAGENANLLAVNVQEFNLSPGDGSITGDKYNNPFLVDIDLKFSKSGGIRNIRKELHDTVAIRNTLRAIYKKDLTTEVTPVCVINSDGSVNTYNQPELTGKVMDDEVLKLSTETVQMEKALGTIATAGSGGNRTGDYKILEIVPDYSADMLQYCIGGRGANVFDYDNTIYGDPYFDRVTSAQFEYYFRKDGGVDISSGFYPNNNNPDLDLILYNSNDFLIHNDLFKISVLKEYIKDYAQNGYIDMSHGVWDYSTDDYYYQNYNAINNWQQSHKLTLCVSTPKDLRKNQSFLENVNLIIIAGSGGEFAAASQYYNAIKGTYRSSWTSEGGDITFDEAKKIYDLIISNKASIVASFSKSNSAPNLAALYKMLFSVGKNNVTKEKVIKEYEDMGYVLSDSLRDFITAGGSGREMFKDCNSAADVDTLYKKLEHEYYNKNNAHVQKDLLNTYTISAAPASSIYLNQMLYNDTSSLTTFYSSGVNSQNDFSMAGMLPAINSSSGGASEISEAFGEVEIVGVSLRGDDGRQLVGNHSWWPYVFGKFDDNPVTYPEVKANYQIDVVKLNDPVEIVDAGESVKIDKVLYLNDYEFEYAKDPTHDAWVFCVINEAVDTPENTEIYLNDRFIPFGTRDDINNPVYTTVKDELVSSYMPVEGYKIEGKQVTNTVECRSTMDITTGLDTNVFDKYIKVTAKVKAKGKEATGTDYAFVVVRDLFDLD